MHLQENTSFDLEVKVTQNVAQYPLHHANYTHAKFEFATSNGLGEDTIKRYVMDGWTFSQKGKVPREKYPSEVPFKLTEY